MEMWMCESSVNTVQILSMNDSVSNSCYVCRYDRIISTIGLSLLFADIHSRK